MNENELSEQSIEHLIAAIESGNESVLNDFFIIKGKQVFTAKLTSNPSIGTFYKLTAEAKVSNQQEIVSEVICSIDRKNKKAFIADKSIKLEFRNLGLSSALSDIVALYCLQHDIYVIHGSISPENIASQKARKKMQNPITRKEYPTFYRLKANGKFEVVTYLKELPLKVKLHNYMFRERL